MNKIELTPEDRSSMRKALLAGAVRTRGMDDEAIKKAFDELGPERKPEPEVDDLHPGEDKPEGKPEQPAKRKARKGAKGKPAPEGEDKPEQGEGGEGQPEQGQPENGQPEGPESLEQAVARIAKQVYDEQAQGEGQPVQIDEQAIIDLIEAQGSIAKKIEYDVIVHKDNGEQKKVENAHPLLGRIIDIVTSGENAYLVGPAGSGKTTLAASVAQALETDFHFTGSVADKYELIGFVDAGGHYHETALYRACKHGGVMLIDEMDGSIPSACNFINAAIENGYIAFPNGEHIDIDKTKTFVIGAGNTIGKGPDRQYVGRYPLDAAFLDRFAQVNVEYDDAIELRMAESAWLEVGGDADKIDNARSWAAEVQAFRALLDERRIVAMVSPRATRRGAKWLAKGWPIEEVRSELYKHLSDDILASLGVTR